MKAAVLTAPGRIETADPRGRPFVHPVPDGPADADLAWSSRRRRRPGPAVPHPVPPRRRTHPPALRPAVDRAAPGATVVLVGLNAERLPPTTDDMVRRRLVLRGSMIYDHPGDFTAALTDLPDARPGAVIDARFPLTRAREAFAGAAGRAGKTWIDFGSE